MSEQALLERILYQQQGGVRRKFLFGLLGMTIAMSLSFTANQIARSEYMTKGWIDSVPDTPVVTPAQVTAPPPPVEIFFTPFRSPFLKEKDLSSIIVKSLPAQSVQDLLLDAGVTLRDALMLVDSLEGMTDTRRLKSGLEFFLVFKPEKNRDGSVTHILDKVNFSADAGIDISVMRQANGSFKATPSYLSITAEKRVIKGTIRRGFYADASRLGISHQIAAQFIKLFSYSIDFQRDVHPGDVFEIGLETYKDSRGRTLEGGGVSYVMMKAEGKERKLYRFVDSSGKVEWMDETAKTNKRMLMRTPIDGARLTSGFGMRHHPIFGYSRMHKGVDFGAPTGTPIYAAGNGVVTFVGCYGSCRVGYGQLVKLKHDNTWSTLYGHMSAFKKGLKQGMRINQGDVIGYVGSTGDSTGAHLHYEVHKDGYAINPMGNDVPVSSMLADNELKKFKDHVATIEKMRQGEIITRQLSSLKEIPKG